VSKGATVHASI